MYAKTYLKNSLYKISLVIIVCVPCRSADLSGVLCRNGGVPLLSVLRITGLSADHGRDAAAVAAVCDVWLTRNFHSLPPVRDGTLTGCINILGGEDTRLPGCCSTA